MLSMRTLVAGVGVVAAVCAPVPAAAIPVNTIVIRGTVEAVIMTTVQVAFSVNVNGTIIVLPCDGSAPQANCDTLEPTDAVLINAHFGELQSVDCEEYMPAYNPIVYDSITVKQSWP